MAIAATPVGVIQNNVEFADDAENIAGTVDNKAVSPLGNEQHFVSRKVSNADAAGTSNDDHYLTVVKALIMLAERVGAGVTWNNTTKKFNLGGYTPQDIAIYLGEENDFSGSNSFTLSSGPSYDGFLKYNRNGFNIQDEYGDFGFNLTNDFVRLTTQQGGAFFEVTSSHFWIDFLTSGLKITRANNIGRIETNNIQVEGSNDLTTKDYVDKTQIGTTITVSRSLALTDAGSKKITPVNSASNIVMTIPSDATLNMPIGSTINLRRRGAGTVEFLGASGVAVEGIASSGGKFIIPRYGIATAYKEAANLWVVLGALES